MNWKVIIFIGLTATIAYSDSVRRYDITLRELNTAEQQLLYEQKRTIGLKKFEVDRQLKEVRRQRIEIERLRAEGSRSRSTSTRTQNRSAPRRTTYKPYRPPEPDWKTVETPMVVVKGTIMDGGQPAALVSGGQIVRSNQIFSTTYRNQMRFWRVTNIDNFGATFDRVTESGEPYQQSKPPSEKPRWFYVFISLWFLLRSD